ncbi:demethylmenaquinone methyltransferase/2-methoxy-6-polyprenyl-1,4-benzoquinol methylase [Weissella beninensis]|nr:demethylmenaquinone methyltransferase/2-methoxy-6-polyprenyl-1,4-benzoquinol methylase [Periweissella beninensis]
MGKEKLTPKEIFDEIAPNYDQMNNVISLRTHWQWRKKVAQHEAIKLNSYVLDLCCGTADWTIMHGKAVGSKGHVIGLDFSQNMLDVAQKKVTASGLDNITLVQGDALHTPYEDNTFDYVTIGFGLRNLPDKLGGLREMYRILKPGGKVIILETSQPDNKLVVPFWRFYFGKIMPLFGKVLTKQKSEYNYLQETTKKFMSYQELADSMEAVGFKNVNWQRFNLGAAAAHYGQK